MRGAGWWPDRQLRLLRRDRAHYDPNRAVHEEAILDGETGTLKHPFIHYNYETLQQFIAKQRKYTDFDTGILLQKGVTRQSSTRPTRRHSGTSGGASSPSTAGATARTASCSPP